VLTKSLNHPDLHELSFGGEDGASVDALREVLDQLNLTAFLGGRKIAILNDTDNLSVVGANILLKSLEEPRPDTYFILIAANATRLPSTVLSRCQRWYFDRLSPADMKRIVSANAATEPDNLALLLAEGSFSSIETMQSRPGMWEEIEDTLDAAFAGQDSRIVMTAQKWASEKDSLRDRLTLLLAATQRRLIQAGESSHHAAAVWAHAVQNVLDAEYLIVDRHVSALTTLITLLSRCNSAHAHTLMEQPNYFPPMVRG
jgi:replication-associated recombination protein RarA